MQCKFCIQVFLGVIRLVEEQERDVSSEISHLVTMVKNLPDSLRVKRLIGEIQRMLEAVHTQVRQRGLSQAMLLEQSLSTEKESKLEDLAEACDLIHPPKELELRAFLHETPATEMDKLRLLIIYLMSFSKGLKEDKVRELLKLLLRKCLGMEGANWLSVLLWSGFLDHQAVEKAQSARLPARGSLYKLAGSLHHLIAIS